MTINGKRWIAGLVGAAISGGAAAVTASATVIAMDPKDWGTFHSALRLFAFTFAIPALISLMKYLQMHPVPDDWADMPDKRGNGNGGKDS